MNNIPNEIAAQLARVMYVLTLSEMPISFFSIELVELNPAERTQLSIDLLYRCARSELVTLTETDEQLWGGRLEDFVGRLAKVDPNKISFKSSDEARQHALDMGVWIEPQIIVSEYGNSLVNEFFLDGSDLRGDILSKFSAAVTKIFYDAGCPWSNRPLIPLEF